MTSSVTSHGPDQPRRPHTHYIDFFLYFCYFEVQCVSGKKQDIVKRKTALQTAITSVHIYILNLVNFGLQTAKNRTEFRPTQRAAKTLGIATQSSLFNHGGSVIAPMYYCLPCVGVKQCTRYLQRSWVESVEICPGDDDSFHRMPELFVPEDAQPLTSHRLRAPKPGQDPEDRKPG